MSRRGVTLLVASVMIIALAVVGAFLPVPYVILSPGPTYNTLGSIGVNGKQTSVIEISGHPTYNDGGNLNFTTVSFQGGPGNQPSLLAALRGWLSDTKAVAPQETVFPPNTSVKKVEQQNTQEMTGSQQAAVIVALREAGIQVADQAIVATVQPGMPATGKLVAGDEIVGVDGTAASGTAAVTDALHKHKPGDTVTLTIKRSGAQQQIMLKTVPSPQDKNKAIIGITLSDKFQAPFQIKISVGDVGGPSAGLMFSLGIYDKITPGGLTGGRFVAGTGEIALNGDVGPIGGIQQKMVAARDAGATIFFVPKGNCNDAKGAAPKGLRLIRADTMDSAVKSLQALKTNPKAALPVCS
jgi:PDZ domain-containing protein